MDVNVTAFLSSVASSIVWALIGVFLLIAALRIFDAMDPLDYRDEIKKGNIAAGIVMGGLLLGMALIVYAAIR